MFLTCSFGGKILQAIAKNDIKTGTVVDLTHEGHGVVKIDRFPIFIPQALINEQIEYKIIKVKELCDR